MDPFDSKAIFARRPHDHGRDQRHRCRARLLSRHGVGSTWRLIDEKEDYAGRQKGSLRVGRLIGNMGDAPIWPGCGAIGVASCAKMTIIDLRCAKGQASPRSGYWFNQVRRHVDFLVRSAMFQMAALHLTSGRRSVFPDQFTLFVVAAKKTYSCNVVWREGGRIGVVFC